MTENLTAKPASLIHLSAEYIRGLKLPLDRRVALTKTFPEGKIYLYELVNLAHLEMKRNLRKEKHPVDMVSVDWLMNVFLSEIEVGTVQETVQYISGLIPEDSVPEYKARCIFELLRDNKQLCLIS